MLNSLYEQLSWDKITLGLVLLLTLLSSIGLLVLITVHQYLLHRKASQYQRSNLLGVYLMLTTTLIGAAACVHSYFYSLYFATLVLDLIYLHFPKKFDFFKDLQTIDLYLSWFLLSQRLPVLSIVSPMVYALISPFFLNLALMVVTVISYCREQAPEQWHSAKKTWHTWTQLLPSIKDMAIPVVNSFISSAFRSNPTPAAATPSGSVTPETPDRDAPASRPS